MFEIWLFRDRVTLSLSYFPQWAMLDKPLIEGHYNGWRLGDRCLDMSLDMWRFNLNFIGWQMPFAKNHYYSDDYDG